MVWVIVGGTGIGAAIGMWFAYHGLQKYQARRAAPDDIDLVGDMSEGCPPIARGGHLADHAQCLPETGRSGVAKEDLSPATTQREPSHV